MLLVSLIPYISVFGGRGWGTPEKGYYFLLLYPKTHFRYTYDVIFTLPTACAQKTIELKYPICPKICHCPASDNVFSLAMIKGPSALCV